MTANDKPVSPLTKPPFGRDEWVLGGVVVILVGLMVWINMPQPEMLLDVTPVVSRRQAGLPPLTMLEAPAPNVYNKAFAANVSHKSKLAPYSSKTSLPSARKQLPPLASIDINHASASQLEALPQVGPVLAKRIVAYRKQHGPFNQLDGLDAVKGVGTKLLIRIRPYLKPLSQ